ncbi:MAG: alginate lyase family protein [Anaerolineae bacterium]|jgi:hypothetical protein|nr:alginate lyase family protein [Anaerolineae bacterium]
MLLTRPDGLFFEVAQVAARSGREQEPLAAAWARLHDPAPEEPLTAALWLAYRHRLLDDAAAGAAALTAFGHSFREDDPPLATLRQAVAQAHILALLRPHPALPPAWLADFAAHVAALVEPPQALPDALPWELALCITAGLLLADADLFQHGVARFKGWIDSGAIHPEGFLKTVADGKGSRTLERQLDAVCALTLAAEAATLAGEPLWQYENRGVGVPTAAAYLVYYYFYPEKWRWDAPGTYTRAMTGDLYRQQGACLEIVQARVPAKALRGVDLFFAEQRPLFSAYGGFTTLTHASPPPPARRGWFGQRG